MRERGRFLDVKTFSRCCVKRTRRDANEVGTLPSISIMHATTKFTHGSTDNMNNNFHHTVEFQLVRVVAIKQQLPRGPEIKARSESCGFMLPVTSASKRPRFVPSPGTRKNTVCLWTESGERPVRQSFRPSHVDSRFWVGVEPEKKKGRKRMEVEAAPQRRPSTALGRREE